MLTEGGRSADCAETLTGQVQPVMTTMENPMRAINVCMCNFIFLLSSGFQNYDHVEHEQKIAFHRIPNDRAGSMYVNR
jgi:hypothetical protein